MSGTLSVIRMSCQSTIDVEDLYHAKINLFSRKCKLESRFLSLYIVFLKKTQYYYILIIYYAHIFCKFNDDRTCLISRVSCCTRRIRINPIWIDYLIVHKNILKGFTTHKLNCFLARRNPNFLLPMEMTGNLRYSFYSEHFTKSQRPVDLIDITEKGHHVGDQLTFW